MTDRRTARESLPFWAAALVSAVAAVWLVWAVPYLPTNDGPQSILSVHMEAHYDDPGTIYRLLLVPRPQLAGRGFSLVYGPLVSWLPWQDALRVVQSLVVLLYGAGGVALSWATHRERRLSGLLAFPLAFGWHHFMGFFSFEVGTSVSVWLLAYAVARRPLGNLDRVALSVGLLLTFLLHAMCAALAGVAIACLALTQDGRRLARDLLWLGSTALLLGGLLAFLLSGDTMLLQASDDLTFRSLGSTLVQLPRLLAPGSMWRGAATVLLLVGAIVGHWKVRHRVSDSARGLFLIAVGLTLIGLVAPTHIPGWQYFGPRVWPLALVSAVALLPLERLSSRARRAAVLVATLVTVISFGAVARLQQTLVDGCSDALAGLEQPIERSGVVMPFQLEIGCGVDPDPDTSEVPNLQPLIHMAALYAKVHGGITAYLFGGTGAIHAFTFRNPPPPIPMPPPDLFAVGADRTLLTDGGRRRAVVTRLAVAGSAYESIVAFGATTEDKRQLLELGYETDFERGSLLLGHFNPCVVTFVAEPTDEESIAVGFGLEGSPALRRWQLALDRNRETVAELPMMCGPVWLETRTASGRACASADERGRIQLSLGRGQSVVRCALGGP